MKIGQLQRKRDEGSAEGRWTAMDVAREPLKVFRGQHEMAGQFGEKRTELNESACRSLNMHEL